MTGESIEPTVLDKQLAAEREAIRRRIMGGSEACLREILDVLRNLSPGALEAFQVAVRIVEKRHDR